MDDAANAARRESCAVGRRREWRISLRYNQGQLLHCKGTIAFELNNNNEPSVSLMDVIFLLSVVR